MLMKGKISPTSDLFIVGFHPLSCTQKMTARTWLVVRCFISILGTSLLCTVLVALCAEPTSIHPSIHPHSPGLSTGLWFIMLHSDNKHPICRDTTLCKNRLFPSWWQQCGPAPTLTHWPQACESQHPMYDCAEHQAYRQYSTTVHAGAIKINNWLACTWEILPIIWYLASSVFPWHGPSLPPMT